MIFRNLWRRPTRSILTILGIAIGVAAVVALGAMAQGMIVNYGTSIGLNNDLLVLQSNALDALYSTLDEEMAVRLRAIPGVRNVDPGVYTWIATQEMPFFLIFGYEPGSVAVEHYRIVEGKPVSGPKQIAIGRRAADGMKKRLDDTLRLYGVPYRIVGIYETGQGMEESGGLVTLADSQEISQKPLQVSLFQVGLTRGADIDQVLRRIEATDKDLSATKASEYSASEQWAGMIEGFAWSIAGIAILVGGLGMMNAMVMTVLERTREIGTLRALGWRRKRVVGLIMGEALVLSLVGGLIGVLVGVGLTELAASVPSVGAFLEGVYSPKLFAQGIITALALGAVGGAYPAWRAANLQPVEALRYEGGGMGDARRGRSSVGWLGRLSRVFGLPFRNLWRRRTRTIISVTGIGIGVATLVMLGGISKGMISELNTLAGTGETGNITVMQGNTADMSLSALDERMVNRIQVMPGVKSASSMLMGFIMTSDMPFFMIAGLDPNSSAMAHYKLIEGRYVVRPNEIVLGKVASENYKVGIGDVMSLFGNRYRVVGIFETGVAFEDGAGMLGLREAQRLLNRPRSVSFIFVDVQNPKEVETVRAAIAHRYPEAQVSLSSQFAQDSGDIESMNAMTDVIGVLALLVGGIVVANTMMMSIHERTREIGTLRAVGWRKRRILGQVVQESLMLCFVAGVLGSIFGVILVMLLAKVPVVSGMLTAKWDVGLFVQAVGVALLIGLVAGIYPAWRASRLQPVEALRYE
jgi:ABC-type antimicrobial peptide transport system permease subunit